MDDAPQTFDIEQTVRSLLSQAGTQSAEAGVEQEVADEGEIAFKREMALYLATPEDKRRVIEKRLQAIAGLPEPKRRTRKDIATVATALGVQQSNVYRLLKRVETFGPVTGLVPGHRVKTPAGAARHGFGEPVDGLIAEAMRRRPDASISEISKVLRSKAVLTAERGAETAFAIPGPGLLRRRIHALRAAGTTGMGDTKTIGASILIDHCPVDVMVYFEGGRVGQFEGRYASMTAILDVPTSIVLGIGVFVEKDGAGGLAAALHDLTNRRLKLLADEGLEIAPSPSTIRWVVPNALRGAAREVEGIVKGWAPPVHLEAITAEESRPGIELYRHLGESFGPFHLQPRPESMTRLEYHYSPDLPEGNRMASLNTAELTFAFEADERNRRKLSGIAGLDRAAVPSGKSVMNGLATALNVMFDPVLRMEPHWSRRPKE